MAMLQSIPGIDPSSVELLEAAGFLDASALAGARAEELHRELTQANSVLRIAERIPEKHELQEWIEAASRRVGGSATRDSATAVNYEGDPEVAEMLTSAPFALPLPAKLLVEKRLTVSSIPPAILLNRVVGDLEIRVAEKAEEPAASQAVGAASPVAVLPPQRSLPVVPRGQVPETVEKPAAEVRVGEPVTGRKEIDVTRVKSVADVAAVRVKGPTSPPTQVVDDRVALIRSPRPETNAGVSPESRRYVRGVMHTHPYRMMVGALTAVLLAVILPVAIISAGLLLGSDLLPEALPWVPKWLLAFPLALPVVGGAYLIWGVGSGRCRICNQPLFVPRRVNKNSKAHHVPWIGYIVPTAFHLLVFRWFRCTYCGTAVRVKE